MAGIESETRRPDVSGEAPDTPSQPVTGAPEMDLWPEGLWPEIDALVERRFLNPKVGFDALARYAAARLSDLGLTSPDAPEGTPNMATDPREFSPASIPDAAVGAEAGTPLDPNAPFYHDAAVWTLLAGGAGLAAFAGFSFGPPWLGFLAGALPTYLLSALACALRG